MSESTFESGPNSHISPLQIYLQGSLFSLYRTSDDVDFIFNEHAGRPLSLNAGEPGFPMLWNTILENPSGLVTTLVEHEQKLERLKQKISRAIDDSFDRERCPYWSTPSKKQMSPSHQERKLKRALSKMMSSYVDSVLLPNDWKKYIEVLVDDGMSRGLSYQKILMELDDKICLLELSTNMQVGYLCDTWVWKVLVEKEDKEFYGWRCSAGFSAVEKPKIVYPTYHFTTTSDLTNEYGTPLRIEPEEECCDVSPSTIYMLGELCELCPGFNSVGTFFNDIAGHKLKKVSGYDVDSDDLFVDLWNMITSNPGCFKNYVALLMAGINKLKEQIEFSAGLAIQVDEFELLISKSALPEKWKNYLSADVKRMVRDHEQVSISGIKADLRGRLVFSISALSERLYWVSEVSRRSQMCTLGECA